jgi:outer membrane protein TolC
MVSLTLALLAGGSALFSAHGQSILNTTNAVDLRLEDFLQQVVHHNETVQAQMLDAEVNRHKANGELGAFEPQLEASITREANKRTNDTQQAAALTGQTLFSERNNIYDGGIEQLIPTGGKIRLGATMSDLGNNVSPYSTNIVWNRQYQTFVGTTFSQPLLKDGGVGPTLMPLRLAALDSDIAFQEYRRQLMLTIYQAEGAYWNLYFAQEQVRFFDDSVSVAQKVLDDSQGKLNAGQSSELDVMEARSALALRNTKRNDAVQNYYDALGRLQILIGKEPDPNYAGSDHPEYRAVDDPHTTNAPPTYRDSLLEVLTRNPDYLIQQKKVDQEQVRLGVAKNELLPELDLKTAYGFNGLALTPGDAWNLENMENTPSWSVGLQLIVPLGGNIKGRNLYQAADLKWNEACLMLKNARTEIACGLSMAIQKAVAWRQSIGNYQTVVDYNDQLLQTELQRFKAGTIAGERVFDAEANLLDSRQELAGALTQYRRALLEIELNAGSILQNRGMDITREGLRQQTEHWICDEEKTEKEAFFPKKTPRSGGWFSPVPPLNNSPTNAATSAAGQRSR